MVAASRPRDAFKRPSGGCSRNFGLRVWCWERAEPCRVLSSRRSVASKDVIGARDGRDDALEILQRRVGVPVRSPVWHTIIDHVGGLTASRSRLQSVDGEAN